MSTKQDNQKLVTVPSMVLSGVVGFGGELCFFGTRQGITSCTEPLGKVQSKTEVSQ